MLTKLPDVDNDKILNDLISKVKCQTDEKDNEKIYNLLIDNNNDYIKVIKIILGIDKKNINDNEKTVSNYNREKYTQIRKFMDNIYIESKK